MVLELSENRIENIYLIKHLKKLKFLNLSKKNRISQGESKSLRKLDGDSKSSNTELSKSLKLV